jgi:hypothetical protein
MLPGISARREVDESLKMFLATLITFFTILEQIWVVWPWQIPSNPCTMFFFSVSPRRFCLCKAFPSTIMKKESSFCSPSKHPGTAPTSTTGISLLIPCIIELRINCITNLCFLNFTFF